MGRCSYSCVVAPACSLLDRSAAHVCKHSHRRRLSPGVGCRSDTDADRTDDRATKPTLASDFCLVQISFENLLSDGSADFAQARPRMDHERHSPCALLTHNQIFLDFPVLFPAPLSFSCTSSSRSNGRVFEGVLVSAFVCTFQRCLRPPTLLPSHGAACDVPVTAQRSVLASSRGRKSRSAANESANELCHHSRQQSHGHRQTHRPHSVALLTRLHARQQPSRTMSQTQARARADATHAGAANRIMRQMQPLPPPPRSSVPPTAADSAAAVASAASASPTRLMLLGDGCAFGSWTDGCSLLLHPTMRTATLLLPDGSNLRILSATAPSASRVKLAQLLALRNMVETREAPALDVAQWTGATFTCERTFGDARWMLETTEQPDSGVQTDDAHEPLVLVPVKSLPDGSQRVEALGALSDPHSTDPRISLTLLPNGQMVRLRYPLLIHRRVKALAAEGAQGVRMEYTYADFQQLVPIAEVPPQWNLPLHSAMRASHVHAIAREEQRLASHDTTSADDERANRENAPHNATIDRSMRAADATNEKAMETLRLFGGGGDTATVTGESLMSPRSTQKLDVVMDLPMVRSLLPSSSRDGLSAPESSGLHWPDHAGLSVPLLHSLGDSLPRDEIVRAIWTTDALYFVLLSGTASASEGSASGTGMPSSDSDCGTAAGGTGASAGIPGVSVVCLVHVDQSALVLKENGFFEHFLEPLTPEDMRALAAAQATPQQGQGEAGKGDRYPTQPQLGSRKKIYAPRAVPAVHNASGLNIGELQYSLGRIAKLATRLANHARGVCEAREIQARQACRTMQTLLASTSVDSCLSSAQLQALRLDPSVVSRAAAREVVFSAAVIERSFMRGVGEFTAFKDGRIKVRFVDRCLLEMDAARAHANMLLPNGFSLALALPLASAEEETRYGRSYVAPALEFAAWAFQTPAQRLEQSRRDQMEREWMALQVEQTMRTMALARIRRGEDPNAGRITAENETMALTAGQQQQPLYLRSAPATPLPFSLRSPSESCAYLPEPDATAPLLALMPPAEVASAHCSPHAQRSQTATMTGALQPPGTTVLLSPHFSLLSPIAAAPSFAGTAADSSLSLTQTFSPSRLPPPSSSLRGMGAVAGSPDPTSSASVTGDLSFWIADLQARNRAMQQRLANTSRSIQACVQ